MGNVLANAKDLMGTSKMALYVYEKKARQLRTVAYADTTGEEPPRFDELTDVVYSLDHDHQRPLVHYWKNYGDEVWAVNEASKEYWEGKERAAPKLGPACESFMYKKMVVSGHAIGVIGIQNERRGVYKGREFERIRELLSLLAYNIGPTLNTINDNLVKTVEGSTVTNFNKIIEKRPQPAHFSQFCGQAGQDIPRVSRNDPGVSRFFAKNLHISPNRLTA
jgi:hypothetical protein